MKHSSVYYPIINSVKNLTPEKFEKFFNFFSSDINTLKEQIKSERKMDYRLFYSVNPLRIRPLIKFENKILCPFPTFIIWQVTNGLYYYIRNEKGFDNAFGNSVQAYVGELLHEINFENKFKIHEEKSYDKTKNTVDWIVEDKNDILFIECKSKRITIKTKSELLLEDIKTDLDIIANVIYQVYKTLLDYKKNLYPNLKYNPNQKIHPIILTLEEWYLFNPLLIEEIKKRVQKKFEENNLMFSTINENPYSIYSISNFEKDFQIMNQFGISNVLDSKFDSTFENRFGEFQFKEIFSEKKNIFIS